MRTMCISSHCLSLSRFLRIKGVSWSVHLQSGPGSWGPPCCDDSIRADIRIATCNRKIGMSRGSTLRCAQKTMGAQDVEEVQPDGESAVSDINTGWVRSPLGGGRHLGVVGLEDLGCWNCRKGAVSFFATGSLQGLQLTSLTNLIDELQLLPSLKNFND